jgi:hypothetical protein
MLKKKKPEAPKPRNVWEIDPATKVHREQTRNDRHRVKEKLKKGVWEEEEEEEE